MADNEFKNTGDNEFKNTQDNIWEYLAAEPYGSMTYRVSSDIQTYRVSSDVQTFRLGEYDG